MECDETFGVESDLYSSKQKVLLDFVNGSLARSHRFFNADCQPLWLSFALCENFQ